MAMASDIPRRRDEDSDWHDVAPAVCETCGCTYHVAKDDPTLVWDPGQAWDEECTDRECHCHTAPVLGARRA